MGPARYGKSTLQLSILHDYAVEAIGKEEHVASRASYCEEVRIPLYLDLDQMGASQPLEELASRWCSTITGQEIGVPQVSELLWQGECLVLLDHLDRLIGRHHLEGLNTVRDFMLEQFPQQRYVLSLPEHDYPLLEDWLPSSHQLRVLPLAEEDVIAFLHAQHGETMARRVVKTLRTHNLWDLARDPYFLSIVLELVRESGPETMTRSQILKVMTEKELAGIEQYCRPLARLTLALEREGTNEIERSRCETLLGANGHSTDGKETCKDLLRVGVLRSAAGSQSLAFCQSAVRQFLAGQALGMAMDDGATLSSLMGGYSRAWAEPLSLLYGSMSQPSRLLDILITPESSCEAAYLASYCVVQNEPRARLRQALHPHFFDPQVNFLLGRALHEMGYDEEARLELEEALRFRPDRADIHYEMAQVLKALGKSEGALQSYQRASAMGPPSSDVALEAALERARGQDTTAAAAIVEDALKALAEQKAVAHCQLSEIHLDGGDLNEALAHAGEAVRLAPTARFQTQMGRVLERLGNGSEARKCFHEALVREPGLVTAVLGLGRLDEADGRLDPALDHYKAALSRVPDEPDHYLNVARAYRLKGNLILSKVYVGTALDMDSSCAPALVEMGAILEVQERYNEAAEQLRRAIDLSPREAVYHYRLGWILKLAGRPAQAETELRSAIEYKPDYAEYYNQLGVILVDLERHREALGAYQRAAQLDSENPLYHRNVGVALAQLGLTQEALGAFDRTLDLCRLPVSRGDSALLNNLIAADAHSERGQILERMGDSVAALKEYQRAVELMPTESAYRLRQALAYGHFSEPSRMLQILRHTVQMRPDDGLAHYHLGESLEAMGQSEEALLAYQRAVDTMPREGQFWKSLGRVQRMLGQLDASVEALMRARDIMSGDADAKYQLGLSLEGASRVQEAENCYREAARQDVDREEYWMALGRCCRSLGRLSDSQTALRRVLFLNPAHTAAHSELAETYLRQGRYQDALDEVLAAIKGDPEVGHYHNQASRIYRESGSRQEALRSLGKAVELQPHRADWRRDLGELLEEMGDSENALAQYEKACQWDPDSSRSLYLLGRLHHRLGRAEEAMNEAEQAVARDPKDIDALIFLSDLYLEKSDAQKALAHCQTLAEIAPEEPKAFYLAFRALMKLERREEAIEQLEKASVLRSDDPDWERELGQAYARVGRLLEAQQMYQKALLNGTDPGLRRELAQLYMRMGWKQEAIKELQKALEEAADWAPETRGRWLLDLGDFYQEAKDFARASATYEEASGYLGNSGEVHERQGSLLVRMGRYQEARTELERAAAGGYAEPRASYTLSLAFVGLGDLEGASRHAIRAAFAEPANSRFQRHLGSVLRIKGDLSSAMNYLQRALDLAPEDPHNLHQMGLALEDKGEIEEALELLRRAIELVPEEPEYHLDLGRLLLSCGQRDEALPELQKAVDGEPNNGRGHFLLGRALEAQGSTERSREQYAAATRLESQVALYHFHLGKALEALGDFNGAVQSLRQAVSLEESQASWHTDLASLYGLMGEMDLAGKEYRRALELAPQGYDGYVKAGTFYREGGLPREAVALLERAVAMSPSRPEAHHQLGLARLDTGLIEEGLKSIQRAVNLASQEPRYQIDLADAYRRRGDHAEAAKRLLSITKEWPEDPEAFYYLGLALADQRWHGEAVVPLSRAIELVPDQPRYRCTLAGEFIALGQYDDALGQLREAADLPSARSGDLLRIGSILEEMGRLEDALEVYRQGLEREQRADLYYQAYRTLRLLGRLEDAGASLRAALAQEERAAWHNELGELLENEGNAADALVCFQRALRMESKEPAYHRNMGVALEKLHRLDDAREALQQAIKLKPDYKDALGHLASVTAKLTLDREVKRRSSQH